MRQGLASRASWVGDQVGGLSHASGQAHRAVLASWDQHFIQLYTGRGGEGARWIHTACNAERRHSHPGGRITGCRVPHCRTSPLDVLSLGNVGVRCRTIHHHPGRKRATLRGKHDRSVGSGASLPPIPSCKRVRTHYSADLELERLPMAGLPVRYTRCQHRPNRSSRSFQVSLKAELLQCISVSRS